MNTNASSIWLVAICNLYFVDVVFIFVVWAGPGAGTLAERIYEHNESGRVRESTILVFVENEYICKYESIFAYHFSHSIKFLSFLEWKIKFNGFKLSDSKSFSATVEEGEREAIDNGMHAIRIQNGRAGLVGFNYFGQKVP